MNGLTRHEMEDIQRLVDQLSNKADLSFNWSSNPSKQSMAAVILYRLGITLNEKHFSRGGTVTGEALKEIMLPQDYGGLLLCAKEPSTLI